MLNHYLVPLSNSVRGAKEEPENTKKERISDKKREKRIQFGPPIFVWFFKKASLFL